MGIQLNLRLKKYILHRTQTKSNSKPIYLIYRLIEQKDKHET